MTAPIASPTGTPRPRRGVVLAVAASLIVLVGVLAVLRPQDDAVEPVGEPLPAPMFTSVPDRPGYLRSDSARTEFWLPTGWTATTETLTPDIADFDGPAAYDGADTILSVSTFDATAASAATDDRGCETKPVAALGALEPTDALVTIVETSASGLPDRPRATGIYEGRPERYFPTVGEANEDVCLARARALGDAEMFVREYVFADAGRSFVVRVALGSETTPERQRETWLVLDRLEFE